MPTYEYACTECGHHLEVVQSFSDDPLTACPSCGGSLRKVFGSIGIVLKGSGFYRTDSRSPSRNGRAGAGKDAAPAEKSDAASPSSGGSEGSGQSKGSEGSSGTGGASPASSGAGSSSGGSSGAGPSGGGSSAASRAAAH